MTLGLSYPWVLLLGVLVLLPWLRVGGGSLSFPTFERLPNDTLSRMLGWAIKALMSLAIGAIVVGLASPYEPPRQVERIGQGAQMVLLLDRSSSMDRPFAGSEGTNRLTDNRNPNAKGRVARRLLAEFVARRANDSFGMLVFSTNPIQVLPLTQKTELVQAAIDAGNIGRGLAKTNLGAGLIQALEFFADREFSGSRIVLLVSDGGARLELPVQDKIRQLAKRYRISLYWIYIRTRHSPGLEADLDQATAREIAPEQLLHQFFSTLGTPYRAYSAENPQALQQAIDDVSRLQNLPIRYLELIPRQERFSVFFALALFASLLLLAARCFTIEQWK